MELVERGLHYHRASADKIHELKREFTAHRNAFDDQLRFVGGRRDILIDERIDVSQQIIRGVQPTCAAKVAIVLSYPLGMGIVFKVKRVFHGNGDSYSAFEIDLSGIRS